MRADLVNLDDFAARAATLLTPHVTEVGGVRRSDFKYLGSAFMAPEVKAELEKAPSRWVISLWVKTERVGYGYDEDAMSTADPSKSAMAAAEALAAEYGMYCKWEPCEKGWGDFYFEGKV